jgi:hypothetical protein
MERAAAENIEAARTGEIIRVAAGSRRCQRLAYEWLHSSK